MRLIDADSLKGCLNGDTSVGSFVHYEIDRALTAYDVDKVVEQLTSESKRWEDSGKEYGDQKELGVAEGFKRAIDIVKRGGVI